MREPVRRNNIRVSLFIAYYPILIVRSKAARYIEVNLFIDYSLE